MNYYILVFFGILLAAVLVTKRLGGNTMVAFAIAGILAGPYGINLYSDSKILEYVGELGMAFLWFSLGLQLGVKRLWTFRSSIIGLGVTSVILTLMIMYPLIWLLDFPTWTPMAALLVALILTISSSGTDLDKLHDRSEVQSRLGRRTYSILLLQNALTIPILALMPIFAGAEFEFGAEAIDIFIMTLGVILGAFLAARLIMNPLIRLISKLKSSEAFLLTIVLTVATMLWAFSFTGLPVGIGAFLAGILFAETMYSHQVRADIAPYQTLFIGLFFITLGMGLQIPVLYYNLNLILMLTAGLIAIKFLAIFLAAKFHDTSWRQAAVMGILLSQGGEFGLLILQTLKTSGITAVPEGHQEIIKGIILLSMITAPILMKIFNRLHRGGKLYSKKLAEAYNTVSIKKPAVVIAGFGRVGKTIAKMMAVQNIPYVAIDIDVDEVRDGQKAGFNVLYGDSTQSNILCEFGLAPRTTKAVIIALDSTKSQKRAIRAVKRIAKNVKIFARAKNLDESKILLAEGARVALPETIESAFLLAEDVMKALDIPIDSIEESVQNLRRNNYSAISE